MVSITSIHEQQTVVKFITNSKMAKCSWPGCSLDTRPQNLPKERCCKNKWNKQWNAWWSQGHAATVLTCCIPISGLYEIFNEPLQTISKTYRYKKRKKPNNRITNTLTHNQECAWLIFGTKIKKKQNTNILTRKRTHSAKKTKILWSSEASHLDPPSLFSTIWAESCIFYKTMLIKECVCRFFTKSCSIPKSEQKCFFSSII